MLAALGLAAAMGAAWWWQKPTTAKADAGAERAPPLAAAPSANGAAKGGAPVGGAGGAPVVVESALVRAQPLNEDVEAVGSLRSRQGTMVRAEVGGRITHINFRDGQRIRRGQLLVQLDDRLPRAQVQQAVAELSIAEANHKRNSDLVAKGFISQRGLDESSAAVKVAQAKAELARATAARMRVLAPFDGVAGLRNISVGDYLREGSDIVNLEDMNAMFVDFRLPERLQSRVAPGQAARVQVDALPDRAFAAVVQAIDPQIDANGRSLNVRGCIDNRLLQLRPGMFARVHARLGNERMALMVAEEAVVSQGGRQSVIRLVKGEGAAGKPAWTSQRVDVKTGTRRAGQVEIVSGLNEDDRIVTAGQQRIQRDGTPVRLAEARGGGNAPKATASAAVADGPAAAASTAPAAVASASAPAASSAARVPAALPWAKTAPGPSPCGPVAQR